MESLLRRNRTMAAEAAAKQFARQTALIDKHPQLVRFHHTLRVFRKLLK